MRTASYHLSARHQVSCQDPVMYVCVYVCVVCVSSDGRVCDVEPVQSESGGLSVGAIAAIAIVIIIVACVIGKTGTSHVM